MHFAKSENRCCRQQHYARDSFVTAFIKDDQATDKSRRQGRNPERGEISLNLRTFRDWSTTLSETMPRCEHQRGGPHLDWENDAKAINARDGLSVRFQHSTRGANSRTTRDHTRSLERGIWKATAICVVSRKPCSDIMFSRDTS
jgi:hypothetical protein